jgi:hypothetical protein
MGASMNWSVKGDTEGKESCQNKSQSEERLCQARAFEKASKAFDIQLKNKSKKPRHPGFPRGPPPWY